MAVEQSAEQYAEKAADRVVHGGGDAPSRAVELLGRVGLVAYGVVHLLVAGLAVGLATGVRHVEVDQTGAVVTLARAGTAGIVLLCVFVAALVAFAAWQTSAAIAGFRWTSGGERVRKRVGAAAKVLAVLAVAVVATRVVLGDPSTGRAGPQLLVSSLLALPAGPVLVGAVAAVVVIVALTMVYTALGRTFLGDLVDGVPAGVLQVATVLGVAGNLGRAVAFGAVGLLFADAARRGDAEGVGGLDLALRTLSSAWQGVAPLLAVSVCLAAFGLYCFVDARYRRA